MLMSELAPVLVGTTNSTREIMLLDFLREHDAPCPVCGYTLRMLSRPICPECGHELVLTVGAARLRIGWLLAAVAPGFFSGIAAFFVLVMIVGRLVFGDGLMSPGLNVLDAFGWCSAIFAIILASKHKRFIAQPRARQILWTLIIWIVHVAALALFLFVGTMYL
jgi:hypothetical protein